MYQNRNPFFSGLAINAISNETQHESYTMSNGIRLIHQRVESPVAYCALMMNTGSRDETEDENGMAHLVEHVFFKETHKRKAHHILSRMENVGGDINAYTTKEDTCVHAAFLNNYYARALELFSDIVFNHKITNKMLGLEKKVVIDEIKSSMDNPSEHIFDTFDEFLFPVHPLGHNTLGTPRSVKKMDKTVVENFIARNYHPSQMVLSSVGNIQFQQLIAYAERYFGGIAFQKKSPLVRTVPAEYIPFEKLMNKKCHQSHCIVGTTCDCSDRKFRVAAAMLANLLGGPGMNTRLNMSLRERKGWVYHVEATYTPYSDIGVFNIYFGTDKTNLAKCIKQIDRELSILKEVFLTDAQLRKLQQQVIGQLAIASDSNDARMLSAGKSVLMFGKVDSLHDICALISGIDADYLCKIANQVFNRFSFLTYQ